MEYINIIQNMLERRTITEYANTLSIGSIVYWFNDTTDMSRVIENDISRMIIASEVMMANHPLFYDVDINE